jgi:hypothetical protein
MSPIRSRQRPICAVSSAARLSSCDRLFARFCGVIKDRCADPDFGSAEMAAETGVSLCYEGLNFCMLFGAA